jgi:N-acetylglucosaminyldiphosphoundecaprenol N-acetyl-beta-D-mannosaminyltransferase
MGRATYPLVKRVLDALLAGTLLVLSLPVALVALAPLRQRVLPRMAATACAGRAGRPFTRRREIIRSGDSAATRWLSRSALADWPVLLSVLAGHVSFVGPRILDVREAAALAPADRDRFAVSPGLVCYAWVQQRTNIDFDDEASTVRRYLADRSLATDAGLLLRAVAALPYGRPAGTPQAAVHISGIRLLNLGMDELVVAIETAIEARARTQIAFVNPACVNIAAGDPCYRATLARADWVCPDGIGMKIAGRILERPIRQNLNGTDLFPRLCAALARSGRSMYLLGARPGVAADVAAWAQRHFPQLRIAGTHSGYFEGDDEATVLAEIRDSGADVLLVAMGVPAQDHWLRHNLKRSGATVGIGVGGLFDFYGGRIPRAPPWLREIGGEWTYRLLQEPRRMWRRYLVGNAVFLWRVVRERRAAGAAKKVHTFATLSAPSCVTLGGYERIDPGAAASPGSRPCPPACVPPATARDP